jgi:hypothetical protein
MASEAEIKMIADFVRKITGIPGVCVLVLADGSCPFGYALASILEREKPPEPAS